LSFNEIYSIQWALPILSNKCFACHGPGAKKKDLRLDSFTGATEDLGGYKAIDTKNLSKSEIILRVHDTDDPMPPDDAEKQLTKKERQLLTQWVKSGGKYAKHWAYVLPKNNTQHQSIDDFIKAGFKKKLRFAKETDKPTLARRASLVLTGLPPEPPLLESFLADNSSLAYENFLDTLLAQPTYGEHQARYWLDAIRYGDTHGLHLDNKRGIYPFRDWVIMAMNENLPLNDFITWQLAGDLLPKPTLAQKVATGFVRMNPTTSEGGAIQAEFQAKNNFDRVETLGVALLGSSLLCVRCHTHKYDPIPHNEYYQLMSFFNNTSEKPLDGNKYAYAPTIKAPANIEDWKAWKKLKAKQTPNAKVAANSPLAEIEKRFTTTLIAHEGKKRKTYILERGEYNLPIGDPLEPGIISVMGAFPEDAPRNRLGLAQWLTSPQHPTVSRVLVNRIWQRVFGNGLVRTPEDFGLQGEQPTHPELLDWLAIKLQQNKWDLKKTLKMMLMSRTFKQVSHWRQKVNDPENKLYARGPSYRLDAEVLRDIALWSSNLLDPHMGGEGVKPYQPVGMWESIAHPGSNTKQYKKDSGKKLYRRSLYVYWKRTSPHPMMSLFDAPNRETSCVKRSRSNTPLQSLALLNETQRTETARMLAERVLKETKNDKDRLTLIFKYISCRAPSTNETDVCLKLLVQMKTKFTASTASAIQLLSTGDMPRDQKLDVIEHAAWAQVSIMLLTSDLAILLY
jgi:hypothetical protein